MNPITHALTGWCLAETAPRLTNRQRAIVVLASVAPDLDGVGILPELVTRNTTHPLLWWSEYHHLLGHNLPFAVLVGVGAAVAAKTNRDLTALPAFVAVHVHLIEDIAGSRGPDGYEWPIPYLYPFARMPELSWSGQWKLNAWQNIVTTLVLLGVSVVLAWRRGYSPLVSSHLARIEPSWRRCGRASRGRRDTRKQGASRVRLAHAACADRLEVLLGSEPRPEGSVMRVLPWTSLCRVWNP